MKEFKYKTIFSSTLKPLVSEEKDKYLALASLQEIKDFIPEVDTVENVDLLPVAFNAAVANRVNKNGDVIDSETAVEIYKNFINKPINVEHNRERVIGTILTASFSEFGTDNPLTEDEAKAQEGPFNITLGGILWKLVNRNLANVIENSADPTSTDYMKISASWELGFNEYRLILLEGEEKNIENGEIVDDLEKIEEMEAFLSSHGGDGKTEDGRYVYRQVINNVLPLGIGLTENPAADVQGVAIKEEQGAKAEATEDGKTEESVEEKTLSEEDENRDDNRSKAVENNSSQIDQNDVKPLAKEDQKPMKITSINDITDESMKTLSASAVHDYIKEELEKASESWCEEKTKTEKSLVEAEENYNTLQKEHIEVKESVESLETKVSDLEAEKTAKAAEERFIQRMAELDETYELTDEDRKILAEQIKDLDDEAYTGFNSNLSVLLRDKNKEVLKAKAEEKATKAETESKEEVKASVENEEVKDAVEEAVENAEVDEESVPVNTTGSEDETVTQKYEKAFGLDQFDIKL